MSTLINRTPTGRLISLHAELKYINHKFGDRKFFLKDMKFDKSLPVTPLDFFDLAMSHPKIGKYDPYLVNSLSPAGFHLTQSVDYDTQKSKSVSECINAMEALGWAERTNDGKNNLTYFGVEIAKIGYKNKDFLIHLRKSLLNYGVFIGFLYKCFLFSKQGIVRKSDIYMGYPNAHEFFVQNEKKIPLSFGSQTDSVVRTRSALFAWAITGGFAWPINLPIPSNSQHWHIDALQEIKNKKWSWNLVKLFIPDGLFERKILVKRPLTYDSMTKSTKALRERGQAEVRGASLGLENRVNNRRFAIVYSLGMASKNNLSLDFKLFIKEMLKYPDYFVIDKESFPKIMEIEKDIAILAGIPFKDDGRFLEPLTLLDMSYLSRGVSEDLLKLMMSIYNKSKYAK